MNYSMQFPYSSNIQNYLSSQCNAIDVVQTATQRAPAKRTLAQLVADIETIPEWKANKKLKTLHMIATATAEDFEGLQPASVNIEPRLEALPTSILAKILQQFTHTSEVFPLALVCKQLRTNAPGAVAFCSAHVSRHLSNLLKQDKAHKKVLAFLAKCPQTRYDDIPLHLTIATSQEKIALPFILVDIQKRFPNLVSLTFEEYANMENTLLNCHQTWMDNIMHTCPALKECRFIGKHSIDPDSGMYPFEFLLFPDSLEVVDFGPNIYNCLGLQGCVKSCTNLKKFHGEGAQEDSSLTRAIDHEIEEFDIPYPNTLEELSLAQVEVGESCSMFLERCPKLRRLELIDCNIQVSTWLNAYSSKSQKAFQALDVLYLDMSSRSKNLAPGFLCPDFDPENDELDDTLDLLEQTIEQEPTHLLALTFLGAYLWDTNEDLEEAKSLLTRAVDIQPRFTLALKILGDIFRKQGDNKLAKHYFDRVLCIDPDDPFVLIRQATLPDAKPLVKGLYDAVYDETGKQVRMCESLRSKRLARLDKELSAKLSLLAKKSYPQWSIWTTDLYL